MTTLDQLKTAYPKIVFYPQRAGSVEFIRLQGVYHHSILRERSARNPERVREVVERLNQLDNETALSRV